MDYTKTRWIRSGLRAITAASALAPLLVSCIYSPSSLSMLLSASGPQPKKWIMLTARLKTTHHE